MQQLWRARTHRGVDTIQKSSGQFYLIGPHHPEEPRSSYGGHQDSIDKLETVLQAYGGDGMHVASPFFSGDFHPRIWRGDESPAPDEAGFTAEWIATVRISRLLFGKLRDMFGYIEPVRSNDAVYGMEQRDLLILACTEVESAWKSVLTANSATPRRGPDRWTTEDYVRLLFPLRLAEWSVTLSAHPAYGAIAPFASWVSARPTASLDWYDAYNAVKHDRENSLPRATFARVLNAMAAVFIMTIAQFGTAHLYERTPFHPDEFRIASMPNWTLEESYIRPLRDHLSGGWLGHERWSPRVCIL